MTDNAAIPKTEHEIRDIVRSIMGGSSHSLKIFSDEEIGSLTLTRKKNKFYLKCKATGKYRIAKPEELVRQIYLRRLIENYGYDVAQIDVEKTRVFRVFCS